MQFKIFILCLSFVLASCGFTPIYGTAFQDRAAVDVRGELAQVEIGHVKDRAGQFLRNALIDRFYVDGRPFDPRYSLLIGDISESRTNLDITKSSDATRAQLRVSTSIALQDVDSGKIVLDRSINAITSFNVLTSEFATRVSEQAARENALNDLAHQIELQIGLYFKR